MFDKLKQLKDLNDQAKRIQSILAEETVFVKTLDGKLSLIMDGNQKVVSLEIEPELLSPEHKDKLETALKEAYNEAIKKVQMIMAQKIQQGGISMPEI